MLRNYLNIAWRQLTSNTFYSVINILGLALGLACCFLIYVYVADELSYDRFHQKRDRIYRIVETFKTGESLVTTGLTPYKLALDLKQQFPEIEKVVRIDYDIASDIVQYGDKQFLQKGITAVDADFFDVFSFRLLEGNPKTALVEPNTVVISDEKARLYFPGGDAMGKVLNFN
jgi:putative ABC transport system permease protein